MNKKLPGIYKGNDYSHVNNNKTIYYSNLETKPNVVREEFNIDEIMFNVPTIIETKDEVLKTKIVSKIKDHILTSNNKTIKINDIRSIKNLKI